MDSDFQKGIKRKCSSSSQIKSSKCKRPEVHINIVDLSDCTLLNILMFLDATSLYQLGETCYRFQQLVQDESLWTHIDARTPPNNCNKAEFCFQNVTKKTKHLLLAGKRRSEVLLSSRWLISTASSLNLTVLALEHQCIQYCKLSEFPSTLQELSFRHSYIPCHTDFFRFAQDTMINLKTLLLDHCQWFEAGSLMSICRYPELVILSLYMCKKLGDDDISSVSLAGKFGFKKLKVIDLRFTGLGDLFIKTFYRSSNLQIMYFQSFPTMYRVERLKRKLDLVSGAPMRKDGYLSDDEANNDLSQHSFSKRFGATNLVSSDAQTITDETMIVFNRLKATGEQLTRPKSSLYVYPYDECTCGFFNKTLGTYGPVNSARHDEEVKEDKPDLSNETFKCYLSSSSNSSDDNDEDDDESHVKSLLRKLERETKKQKRSMRFRRRKGVFFLRPDRAKICRKLVYNSCALPAWCQTWSNPISCQQKWLYVREPRNDYEISMLEHTDKYFKVRSTRCCGKENPDCDCGDSGDEEGRNVIVISRNSDGGLVHFRPYDSVPRPNETVRKQVSDEDVSELIKKISEFIEKLSEGPDNETSIVINEVLAAFDECLKTKEFCKYAEDGSFVRDLRMAFFHMSRNNILQSIKRVLDSHFKCFQDLLRQLEKDNNDVNRKRLIEYFFKNLSCREGTENQNYKMRNSYLNEYWNLPGPSGVQPSKKRKRKHIKGKDNKTKTDESDESKNDSDSDTAAEKLKKYKRVRSFDTEEFDHLNVLASHIYEVADHQNGHLIPERRTNRGEPAPLPLPLVNPEVDIQFDQPARNFVRLVPAIWPAMQNNLLAEMFGAANARIEPTNIKELSLRGYRVGDVALNLLKEMELDLLDVTGTNVTFAGVQQFMMSNPQCRLIHEFACICRPKLHF